MAAPIHTLFQIELSKPRSRPGRTRRRLNSTQYNAFFNAVKIVTMEHFSIPGLSKSRLVALTDGIVATVMTVLVLSLTVPGIPGPSPAPNSRARSY
ncbi:MAG TPA: hypothetical protein VFE98_05385 [Candidatus Bathyarchaeia archaeon]|nr:hypothetical protein [Candidatus Bathyarchaeia archaeon]